jgi:hypothetical protein
MTPIRTSRRLIHCLSALVLLCSARAAQEARAQQPPPPPPVTAAPPVADSTRRAATGDSLGLQTHALDGSRVRAGSWLYTTTLRADTTVHLLGEIEVRVAESTYAGSPSWLLTTVGQRAGALVADSLWVARADLKPQHWSAALGPARLVAEFTRDTIYSAITEPLGRRSLVASRVPKLLVSEAMTDVVLGLLPLDSTFSDSVAVMAIDIGATASPPARIFVEGQEKVVVPAGTFDAWIVSLESERGAMRLWVGKDDHLVLKAEQTLPAMNGAVLRRELLRGG